MAAPRVDGHKLQSKLLFYRNRCCNSELNNRLKLKGSVSIMFLAD